MIQYDDPSQVSWTPWSETNPYSKLEQVVDHEQLVGMRTMEKFQARIHRIMEAHERRIGHLEIAVGVMAVALIGLFVWVVAYIAI